MSFLLFILWVQFSIVLWLVSAYKMMTTRVNRLAKDSFDELSKEINREGNWSHKGERTKWGENQLSFNRLNLLKHRLKRDLCTITLISTNLRCNKFHIPCKNVLIFIFWFAKLCLVLFAIKKFGAEKEINRESIQSGFNLYFCSTWRFICVVYWIKFVQKWRWSSWNAIIQKMFDIRLT